MNDSHGSTLPDPWVSEFAYVRIAARDLDAWDGLLVSVLGMEPAVAGDGARAYKMDRRPFRYLVAESDRDGLDAIAWRAPDATALEAVRGRLRADRMPVRDISAKARADRCVTAGFETIWNGLRIEVVVDDCGRYDRAGDFSRFVANDLGLGHVTFDLTGFDEIEPVFRDAMRMYLHDDIPIRNGGRGRFYACNGRHHSVGLIANGRPPGVAHIACELATLDDVGTALDGAMSAGLKILAPLGRHRTDHIVSFYMGAPSGFAMEVGCGGVLVEDHAAWPTVGPSLRKRPWGHGGAYIGLPPE